MTQHLGDSEVLSWLREFIGFCSFSALDQFPRFGSFAGIHEFVAVCSFLEIKTFAGFYTNWLMPVALGACQGVSLMLLKHCSFSLFEWVPC